MLNICWKLCWTTAHSALSASRVFRSSSDDRPGERVDRGLATARQQKKRPPFFTEVTVSAAGTTYSLPSKRGAIRSSWQMRWWVWRRWVIWTIRCPGAWQTARYEGRPSWLQGVGRSHSREEYREMLSCPEGSAVQKEKLYNFENEPKRCRPMTICPAMLLVLVVRI